MDVHPETATCSTAIVQYHDTGGYNPAASTSGFEQGILRSTPVIQCYDPNSTFYRPFPSEQPVCSEPIVQWYTTGLIYSQVQSARSFSPHISTPSDHERVNGVFTKDLIPSDCINIAIYNTETGKVDATLRYHGAYGHYIVSINR